MPQVDELMSLRGDYSAPLPSFERDTHWKELLLSALTLIFGAIAWWLTVFVVKHDVFVFSSSPVSINMNTVTLSGITAILFILHLAFFMFTAVFNRQVYFIPLAAMLSVLPGAFLLGEGVPLIFAGTILYLFAVAFGRYLARRALANQQTFSLYGIVRAASGIILTVLLINVSIIYYIDISSSKRDIASVEAPTVSYTVLAINSVLNSMFKDYSPLMTIDSFIEYVSVFTSGKPGENELPEDAKKILTDLGISAPAEKLIEEERRALREQFLKSLGIKEAQFSGNASITKVWEAFAKERVVTSLSAIEKYIPAIAALGLFFTLIIFMFLYKMLIFFFSWLIMKFFLMTKFLRWEEVMVPQRRLSL